MDRCARSLTDLYAIVDELASKGVSVKFLKERQTYSKDSTPITKLMLGLLGSLAEFEASIIKEPRPIGSSVPKRAGSTRGGAKVFTDAQEELRGLALSPVRRAQTVYEEKARSAAPPALHVHPHRASSLPLMRFRPRSN